MSPYTAGRRRVHRSVAAGLPLAVLAALAVTGTAVGAPYRDARVTGTATLGDLSLGPFSNALLPGTVADDRGVDLGGIGSDLYPAGRRGEFWRLPRGI